MNFPFFRIKHFVSLIVILHNFILMSGVQALRVGEPVEEFANDNKIFRNGSIRFEPNGIVHSYGSDQVLSPSSVTFLSKQFIGEKTIGKDTSDKDVQNIRTAYDVLLSFETTPEKIKKIKEHEKLIQIYRKCRFNPREIEKHIEFYKQKGEWGPIVTRELQKEKEKQVRDFKETNNQFLLRHTLSYSTQYDHVSGTVVLYPGNNWKILEDGFSSSLAPARWEAGHLQYEIFVNEGKLHINHIGVESLWRSKGIGYAIAQYFTYFCGEHFSQVSDLTVNCRNDYSARIFEKCGFRPTTAFEGATHHLSNYPIFSYDFEDGQKLIPTYHQSERHGYLAWLNENYTKFFPKRLHKVGYMY